MDSNSSTEISLLEPQSSYPLAYEKGEESVKKISSPLLCSFGLELPWRSLSVPEYAENMLRGIRVFIIDAGKMSPPELEIQNCLLEAAEERFNESQNERFRAFLTHQSTSTLSSEEDDSWVWSSDSTSLPETCTFEEKMCRIFRFQGHSVRLGRLRKNCPLNLQKNQLVTLTTDRQYKFCSTASIIFVENLEHCMDIFPGSIVEILGKKCAVVVLRVVKILGPHLTCCIQKGGSLVSFGLVLNQKISPLCFTETDELNCQAAVRNKVQGVILPSTCRVYGKAIRKRLNEIGGGDILVLAETDLSQYESCREFECQMEPFDGVYLKENPTEAEEGFLLGILKGPKKFRVLSSDAPTFSDRRIFLVPDCFVVEKFKKCAINLPKIESRVRFVHEETFSLCQNLQESPLCYISVTKTGHQPQEVASLMKKSPILAVTNEPEVVRLLHLTKGVKPLCIDLGSVQRRDQDFSVLRHILRSVVAFLRHQSVLQANFCIRRYRIRPKNNSQGGY